MMAKLNLTALPTGYNTSNTSVVSKLNKIDLEKLARTTGVLERLKTTNEDALSLIEMNMYGLKGIIAYFDHAELIREHKSSVYTEEEATKI